MGQNVRPRTEFLGDLWWRSPCVFGWESDSDQWFVLFNGRLTDNAWRQIQHAGIKNNDEPLDIGVSSIFSGWWFGTFFIFPIYWE